MDDVPRHFPFVTRLALSLHAEGRLPAVHRIDVEPEFGYVTRLHYRDGGVRMTRANDVGLNPGAATEVVKDKAHTKFFLRSSGVCCPRGEAFLMTWWAEHLRPGLARQGMSALRGSDQLVDYVREHLPLPVYLKPVDGSKGANVWYCPDEHQIRAVLATFAAERVRVALVEEAVELPDFRLVVLDSELISAYQRVPLTVTGDGRSSIADLVADLREAYHREGRDATLSVDDARVTARLSRLGVDSGVVPTRGEQVRLLDHANLSAGGTAIDLTGAVHPRWRRLAVDIAAQFGLRLCGIDLACADLTTAGGPYSVIEVNATPGLDHYGAVGAEQERLVRDLYAKVLNVSPV